MAQEFDTPVFVSAFRLHHEFPLQLGQFGVGEEKRDGHTGHPIGAEPLIG